MKVTFDEVYAGIVRRINEHYPPQAEESCRDKAIISYLTVKIAKLAMKIEEIRRIIYDD